jgi:hypothetical protein
MSEDLKKRTVHGYHNEQMTMEEVANTVNSDRPVANLKTLQLPQSSLEMNQLSYITESAWTIVMYFSHTGPDNHDLGHVLNTTRSQEQHSRGIGVA